MSLVYIVLTLLIIGMVLWGFNRWIPLPSLAKTIINVVVVVLTILWLLSLFFGFGFGVWHLEPIHLGRCGSGWR
jgi:hypothetical protein